MQEVLNTIHLYFHHLDAFHRDASRADKFAALFEADAVFSFPKRGIHKKGRAEMKALCEALGTRFQGFSHIEANVVVDEVSEGVAASVSYWTAWDKGSMASVGRHEDTLARDAAGKWLFRERLVTVTWTREEGNIEYIRKPGQCLETNKNALKFIKMTQMGKMNQSEFLSTLAIQEIIKNAFPIYFQYRK
ncbi:hypothetical protein BDR26DRAFT_930059 [Obelidium mucronatum]|nr:hypothetical protein BDR26DRAFT_930059 [Obelidium mucronatum]